MPKKFLLSESGDRGWFVGGFDRAVFSTTGLEAAYQYNYPGEISEAHYHKIATEINLITRGRVVINGEEYTAGMGIIFYPGDICECEYLEDTETMVLKVPGPLNDKYMV
jgi:gentisate 1,2-dioxygenase